MAATVVNTPNPGTIKLTRGKAANAGVIGAANTVVQFTVPEPSRDHQGNIVIQVSNTGTLVGATFKLECSLDGGVQWFDVVLPTASTTADFTDTAASAGFGPVNLSGFGAGALFRFGISAVTSGTGTVWILCG